GSASRSTKLGIIAEQAGAAGSPSAGGDGSSALAAENGAPLSSPEGTSPALAQSADDSPSTGPLVRSAAPRATQVMPPPPRSPTLPGIALVPAQRPSASIADRMLDLIAEIEAASGPRLELALIRAQLIPAADLAGRAELARELTARFPDALAARVATAR